MSAEPTDFLYPFIEADERDAEPLLADLARSAEAKAAESARLRAVTLEQCAPVIDRCGGAMAERFAAGGRLFTFGNGGSSTDAAAIASQFARPAEGRPLPALSLAAEPAVLSALGNDIGYDSVFARQLIAHARAGDIAIGVSTSGGSENVLRAFAEATRRGMLTVGLCGYGGGRMIANDAVHHCLIVSSDSVHRVQEVQAALAHALWAAVQARLDEAVPLEGSST